MIGVGDRRKLIFANVANGVEYKDIMVAFQMSRLEVEQDVRFVAKKIREYRFRRGLPPLFCDTVPDIRYNRLALLDTLKKLGPKYLVSELVIPSIGVQKLDSPEMAAEAAHRISH